MIAATHSHSSLSRFNHSAFSEFHHSLDFGSPRPPFLVLVRFLYTYLFHAHVRALQPGGFSVIFKPPKRPAQARDQIDGQPLPHAPPSYVSSLHILAVLFVVAKRPEHGCHHCANTFPASSSSVAKPMSPYASPTTYLYLRCTRRWPDSRWKCPRRGMVAALVPGSQTGHGRKQVNLV